MLGRARRRPSDDEPRATTRHERLLALLVALRGVPVLDVDEALRLTPLTPLGRAALDAVTEDDLALASAALSVEAELRERGYATLEVLGALVGGMRGSLDERLAALPEPQFVEAACALLRLGWIDRGS